MTLRLLILAAVLAWQTATPAAQTFRWQAGGDDEWRIRLDERLVVRLRRGR